MKPLIILLLSAIPLLIQASNQPDTGKHSGSKGIIYLDVHIDQPNVEDCYETSVPDLTYDSGWFNVYPNPNQGIFHIEVDHLNEGEQVNIAIHDLTGKEVHNVGLQATGKHIAHELNLTAIPKGVYFLSVQVNQHHNVKRLIIY